MENSNQQSPEAIQPKSNPNTNWKDNLPIKLSPILIISFSFLIVVIILLFAVLLLTSGSRGVSNTPLQSPIPSASPFETQRIPSAFSQTEEFKNFELHYKELENSLNSLDLNEPKLVFPLLDMDVNYNK